MQEALLNPAVDGGAENVDGDGDGDSDGTKPSSAKLALHGLLVVGQLTLAFGAVTAPFFERTLTGSMVAMVHEIGVDLNDEFSLLGLCSLMPLDWEPGLINTVTYFAFTIFFPLLQPLTSLCVLVGLAARWPKPVLRRLHHCSGYFSYFSGQDVMLIVVLLVHNSQFSGEGTQGLLNVEVFPPCATLDEIHPEEGHCFQMDLAVSSGFWFAVGATCAFFVSGAAGSPTHKFLHHYIDPWDDPPPHCGWMHAFGRRSVLPDTPDS